ncbi:MAG: hypothetical protein KJ638_14285 [Chloroflexi bacterium]|nr:hypothetical protein [Chloroflexota bacterium]
MPIIDHDIHLHTYLSSCCSDKEHHRPGAIITLAEEMGLNTIGFSDHIWANPDLEPNDWYRPQDESQISRLRSNLAAVSTDIRVLIGCEADTAAPGKFSITPEFAQGLDYVLLACNHFHLKDVVQQPESDSAYDIARHILAFFISGVRSGLATSIAHPFVPYGYLHQYDQAIATISEAEFLDTFGIASEMGVGIEITVSFFPPKPEQDSPPQPCWNIETPIRVLSLAKQAGCKFTFGTDAHCPERQRRLPELSFFEKILGLTGRDVLAVSDMEGNSINA